jgi:hypothetical protein
MSGRLIEHLMHLFYRLGTLLNNVLLDDPAMLSLMFC